MLGAPATPLQKDAQWQCPFWQHPWPSGCVGAGSCDVFGVDIVSSAFAGKLPLARHRLVYAALGDMMQTDIHALSIRARTPGEAG